MKHEHMQPKRELLADEDVDELALGPNGADGVITDPDVARVFKAEQVGHGEDSGRAHAWHILKEHNGLDAELRAGDPDAVLEDVMFVGEEAPGGANPTPGMSDVDDVGRALGLHYQDNEPLDMTEKMARRDDERWELDPASSEDYAERSNADVRKSRA